MEVVIGTLPVIAAVVAVVAVEDDEEVPIIVVPLVRLAFPVGALRAVDEDEEVIPPPEREL